MSVRRALGSLAAAALLTVAWAGQAPSDPVEIVDGSELIVTDPAGGSLLGYGRVENREVRLELASGGELFLTLVGPDGTFRSWRGEVAPDGSIVLREGGEQRDLAAMFSEGGVGLSIRRVARMDDQDDVGEEADAGEEDVASDPPGAGEPAAGPPDDVDDAVDLPDPAVPDDVPAVPDEVPGVPDEVPGAPDGGDGGDDADDGDDGDDVDDIDDDEDIEEDDDADDDDDEDNDDGDEDDDDDDDDDDDGLLDGLP